MNPARYRPPHQPRTRGEVIVMNTGTTRQREGDWSVVAPDGTRKAWAGRVQNEEQG